MIKNIIFCMLFAVSPSFAAPAPDRKPVPEVPLGNYRIVGSMPDSGGCFEGTCTIKKTKDGRNVMIRMIAGETVESEMVVRRVVEDVFEVVCHFTRNGVDYVARYNYALDGNLYARLTGTVERKNGRTGKCGLEALFDTTMLRAEPPPDP